MRIEADGSFRNNGLAAWDRKFSVAYPVPKGLALARIERDGAEQKNGIEVGSNEEIGESKSFSLTAPVRYVGR